MDKKSKILLVVFLLLIIASVSMTFWRVYIQKDYIIQNQIDCDPTVDACFVWECDPESTVEGEACIGDPEMDIWYYAIAQRKAYMIPDCDANDEDCIPFECPEGEKDCSITLCDETNKEEQGVECNDPVQYNIDNPEEEEEACEEDDEECLAEEEESECAEDDEECLATEEDESECEEGDEECVAAANEDATCDPGTEDCSDAATNQSSEVQDNTGE